MVIVTGKGRKERWMPLGATALQALWEYLMLRSQRAGKPTTALWISPQGRPLTPKAIYLTIKALGARAHDPGLHIHRFRHTSAINLLREGMSEPMLRLLGGWKKIPETYLRTPAAEDAARIHREISPADRLGEALEGHQARRRGSAKGRL